jgi:hypothetical protein
MRQVMAPIGSRRLLPSRQHPGRRPRRKTAATAIQQIPIHWNGKSMPYSIRPSYSWESIPVFGTLTVPAAAEHHVAKPTLTSVWCVGTNRSIFASPAYCESGAVGDRVVLYSYESGRQGLR